MNQRPISQNSFYSINSTNFFRSPGFFHHCCFFRGDQEPEFFAYLRERLTQPIFLHNFESGTALHFKSILFILDGKTNFV